MKKKYVFFLAIVFLAGTMFNPAARLLARSITATGWHQGDVVAWMTAATSLVNELRTDHATFKTSVDAIETALEELMDDHATFKVAVDSGEVAIEELMDDHATFKVAVDSGEVAIEELIDDHATFKVAVDSTEVLTEEVHDQLAAILGASSVWNPAELASKSGATSADITVTGAALGDFVLVTAGTSLDTILATGFISATDKVAIRLFNTAETTIDLAESTWKVKVIPSTSLAALTAPKPSSGPATLAAPKPSSGPATLAAPKPSSGPATLASPKPASAPATISAAALSMTGY